MALYRLLPFVFCLMIGLAAAFAGSAFVYGGHIALVDRALVEGRHTAEMSARTVALLRELPRVGEELIGDQLVAQAMLVDQLVTASETPKPGDVVNNRLAVVVGSGALAGALVTDGNGKTVYRSRPTPDVTFGADGVPPVHGRAIGALMSGTPSPAVTPAERLDGDGPVLKQAAIRGARGRMVQVTADVSRLAQIAKRAGIERVVDDLLDSRVADAVWLLDTEGRSLAHGAVSRGEVRTDGPMTETERALARQAVEMRTSKAMVANGILSAAAPVLLGTEPFGILVVRSPAGSVWGAWWWPALVALIGTLVLGGAAFRLFEKHVAHAAAPLRDLTDAAKALAAGRFNPFSLSELCNRNDLAGEAGRAFRVMAREIEDREDGLEVKLLLASREDETPVEPQPAAPVAETPTASSEEKAPVAPPETERKDEPPKSPETASS